MKSENNIAYIAHLPDRVIELESQNYLYFSGTAYLGLSQNKAFKKLLHEGTEVYGNVYGSSRNGNLQLTIYSQAEKLLADWCASPAALTVSSGMLAGQIAIHYLLLEQYQFIYSPDAHPAVWHTPTASLPSGSYQQWTDDLLNDQLASISANKLCIVSNSVDALRGKLYNFEWVEKLPKDKQILLLIDDSHGVGISGSDGSGVWPRIPKNEHVKVIVTTSLAKAMGVSGGAILSEKSIITAIKHTAFFGGCSPMAPHQLYAFTEGHYLYKEAYEKLQSNIQLFLSYIKNLKLFEYTENFPVFYTSQQALYTFLLQKNILIYSFSYPKPTDKPNTRIVISAWHTPADIEQLGKACQEFCQ